MANTTPNFNLNGYAGLPANALGASSLNLPGNTAPAQPAAPLTDANLGMVQLPSMPQPYFPTATSAPVATPQAAFAQPAPAAGMSLPALPTPDQLVGPLAQPTSTAAIPQANTPIMTIPEVPPPQMVAPYLYASFPKAAPPQIFQPQTPPVTPPAAPQVSQPSQHPAPPQQTIPQAPAPSTVPQQPVASDAMTKSPKATASADGPLSDKVVTDLNAQLDSTDENIRKDAGFKLYNILDKNPNLASDPTYKPYVDAFLQKIMDDPSEIARMPGLMICQMGLVKQPNQAVMTRLQELANKSTNSSTNAYIMDTGEASMANNALQAINNPAPPETQDKSATATATDSLQPKSLLSSSLQPSAPGTAGGLQTASTLAGTPTATTDPSTTTDSTDPALAQAMALDPTALPTQAAPTAATAATSPVQTASSTPALPVLPMAAPVQTVSNTPAMPALPAPTNPSLPQAINPSITTNPTPGGQLNINSVPQAVPTALTNPQVGQRMNVQEGF